MEQKEQIDLTKFITPTDFDSPEVIEEMKIVQKQIDEVLDGQKIDRSKMLTTFNIEEFCNQLPKTGSSFGMKYSDWIRYGIIYGAMGHYNTTHPQNKAK